MREYDGERILKRGIEGREAERTMAEEMPGLRLWAVRKSSEDPDMFWSKKGRVQYVRAKNDLDDQSNERRRRTYRRGGGSAPHG